MTAASTPPPTGLSATAIVMQKWGGRPHWEFTSWRLGEDADGTWFGTPVGTTFTRPGSWHLTEQEHVVLVPRVGLLGPAGSTADWVATFYAVGARLHTYVDITTPSVVAPDRVVTTDLDLDVVRPRDGEVFVDDEDEFAEHRGRFGYPEQVVTDAVATCERVRRAVVDRRGPFDDRADLWLATLADRTATA